MLTKRINFEVKLGDGIDGYWIGIDDREIRICTGVGKLLHLKHLGSIELAAGNQHTLAWWFVGDAKSKLSIVGKIGDTKVFEVEEFGVTEDEYKGIGSIRFEF